MTSIPTGSDPATRTGVDAPATPRTLPRSLFGNLRLSRQMGAAAIDHRSGYRPDIDGLRAIAVLSVVLYHAAVAATSGGFVGVDVFFVISGYVISKSLQADLERGHFSVMSFYERRVRRIFPAMFVMFAATWLVAFMLLLPTYFADYSQSLAASAGFVSNVYFWKASGYFANGANLRPLLHTWSLSVEEQFYLFAPLTLFAVHRWFGRRWALVLGPAAVASLALSAYAARIGPTANFFLLPTRAWELLLGAVLQLRPPAQLKARWVRELIGLAGLALIAWPVFGYTEATPFPGLTAIPPCLGAALLIYVGANEGSAVTRLLSLPALVAVGLISYSVYLVHWPIISFATFYTLRAPTPWESAAIVAASLTLGALSWRFIEQPFRHKDFRPSRRALLGGALAAMAAFIALGAVGVLAKGFPGRFPAFHEEQTVGSPAGRWREGVCFLDSNPDIPKWNARACTITPAGHEMALLWGDSYAAHYVPGIEADARNIPYTVLEYTAAGCPPVLSYTAYDRPNCQRFNQNALSVIRRNNVKVVVLSARWVDQQRRGLEQLTSTLTALSRMGVRAYVIGQSPMFTTHVQVIEFRNRDMKGQKSWPMAFDPDVNAKLRAIAGPSFVDPLPYMCRGKLCRYVQDGRLLFADEGHLSAYGSVLATPSYFPLVVRPPQAGPPR